MGQHIQNSASQFHLHSLRPSHFRQPSAFSLGDLCVPPMANVLKVFLENGQTKSFKYDNTTTVQVCCNMLMSVVSLIDQLQFVVSLCRCFLSVSKNFNSRTIRARARRHHWPEHAPHLHVHTFWNRSHIKDVVTSLRDKLCLSAEEHFSLVLEHVKSLKRNKLTLLDPQETLARVSDDTDCTETCTLCMATWRIHILSHLTRV